MIIAIIVKSPFPEGRIGTEEEQDWYQSLVLAAALARRYQSEYPRFLIVTAFKRKGSAESEAQTYDRVLDKLAPEFPRTFIQKGFETIEQIDHIRRYGDAHVEKLFIVSTRFHYRRVRYLARGIRAVHVRSMLGRPRPSEVKIDLLLGILTPLIASRWVRPHYLAWLTRLRQQGEF